MSFTFESRFPSGTVRNALSDIRGIKLVSGPSGFYTVDHHMNLDALKCDFGGLNPRVLYP